MMDRDFKFNKTKVRYGCGQPMGLYTSWAGFAVAHHGVIQYLASTKGFNSFDKYAVLGDDVVIWERDVAIAYEEFMNSIGVTINRSKSLISDELNVRVEFAKRIFYNHEEYSPLGYELLEQVSGSCYQVPILLREFHRRGWKLPNGV